MQIHNSPGPRFSGKL